MLGLALQVVALGLLALLNREWSLAASVAYVMGCQALSGIAKDLTKMSAKSAIKVLVPAGDDSGLFKWVAVLTGSKNALKGAGFFVGGLLLSALGFRGALYGDGRRRAAWCSIVRARRAARVDRPGEGEAEVHRHPVEFAPASTACRWRGSALFAARDVWFVVSVPIFLASVLGWTFTQVGGVPRAVGDRLRRRAEPLADAARAGSRTDRRRARRWRPALGIRARGVDRADSDRAAARRVAGGIDARRAGAVRDRLRAELVGALVSRARVLRGRSRVAERRLLLHGERVPAACSARCCPGVLYEQAGVTASLWGAVVLAGAAGVGAMFLPPVERTASWAAAKGDD